MKQQRAVGWIALALLVSTLACSIGGLGSVRGSGSVTEEERRVSSFTKVSMMTIGNLYIEVGDEESLTIEAEDNLLEYFVTEVSGDTLEIKMRSGVNLDPTSPVNFYLTVKDLNSITLAGAGNVEAQALRADRFSAVLSGSGDIQFGDLNADTFEAVLSGSGDLRVSGGQVGEQIIILTGSGKYDARGLRSDKADVTISGSGSTTINVRQSLRVNISGSGSVRYVGSPSLDRLTVSGSGTIEKIGD